jgi:hypothetical protein
MAFDENFSPSSVASGATARLRAASFSVRTEYRTEFEYENDPEGEAPTDSVVSDGMRSRLFFFDHIAGAEQSRRSRLRIVESDPDEEPFEFLSSRIRHTTAIVVQPTLAPVTSLLSRIVDAS